MYGMFWILVWIIMGYVYKIKGKSKFLLLYNFNLYYWNWNKKIKKIIIHVTLIIRNITCINICISLYELKYALYIIKKNVLFLYIIII